MRHHRICCCFLGTCFITRPFKSFFKIVVSNVEFFLVARVFKCFLEKYFEMKKVDCKAALEIYKRFISRMDRVSEFLKIAEDAGIDKGDIPDLSKAPSSLLEALEEHYQSLEKGKPVTVPSK